MNVRINDDGAEFGLLDDGFACVANIHHQRLVTSSRETVECEHAAFVRQLQCGKDTSSSRRVRACSIEHHRKSRLTNRGTARHIHHVADNGVERSNRRNTAAGWNSDCRRHRNRNVVGECRLVPKCDRVEVAPHDGNDELAVTCGRISSRFFARWRVGDNDHPCHRTPLPREDLAANGTCVEYHRKKLRQRLPACPES